MCSFLGRSSREFAIDSSSLFIYFFCKIASLESKLQSCKIPYVVFSLWVISLPHPQSHPAVSPTHEILLTTGRKQLHTLSVDLTTFQWRVSQPGINSKLRIRDVGPSLLDPRCAVINAELLMFHCRNEAPTPQMIRERLASLEWLETLSGKMTWNSSDSAGLRECASDAETLGWGSLSKMTWKNKTENESFLMSEKTQ